MTGTSGRPDAGLRFDGRVAIVTGATKGLGRAIAAGFAAAGATVVVSSRSAERCAQAAEEIHESTGAVVMPRACHIGEWDLIPGLVEDVMDAYGRIDVVVNNAGIMPMLQAVADIELTYWRKMFAVNVEGPLRLSQLVAPIMRDGGGGSIVNVSSISAYRGGGPGNTAYGAAKAAIISMTRNMAREWAGWNVRVNAVSPGPMRTAMNATETEVEAGSAAATMLQRLGEPSEVVGPVLYLASDAASFVTGEDHVVAGGMLRG